MAGAPALSAIKVSIRSDILAAHEKRPFKVFRIPTEEVYPLEKSEIAYVLRELN